MTNSRPSPTSKSTVSEYVGAFRNLSLVGKVPAKEGRWFLEIEEEDRRYLFTILSNLERDLLSATDSFVDLWDF